MEINRTKTVLMDTLLTNLKTIISGLVVKDTELANSYETKESLKRAQLLIACIEKIDNFRTYPSFSRSTLLEVGIDPSIIDKCVKDKNNIPESYRDYVVEVERNNYINSYIEINDYYRMLNGLPNYETVEADYIYLYKEFSDIPDIEDMTIPIHELSNREIDILTNGGYIDKLISKYPTYKYLKFLGKNKIDIYTARKSYNFAILKVGYIDNLTLVGLFRNEYLKSRNYIMTTFYSRKAFKQKYYSSIIGLFILFSTINHVFGSYSRIVISRDFYNKELLRNIFESYNVKFYEEMPLTYLRRIAKRLNILLRLRGTDEIYEQLFDIFNYKNTDIYKYFLLRRQKLKDGMNDPIIKYKTVTDEDGNIKEVLDNSQMYDLQFVPVKIGDEDNLNKYLTDADNMISYDEFVEEDLFWGNGVDKINLKNEILDIDFNYEQTQYISLNAMYNLSELTYEMAILIRFFQNNKINIDNITLDAYAISSTKRIKLFDFMLMIIELFSRKFSYEGFIHNSPTQIIYVLGFNTDVDWEYLKSQLSEDDQAMIGDYINLDESSTITDLFDAYNKNKAILEFVKNKLITVTDIKEYILYETIYTSIVVSEINIDLYRKKNGEVAENIMDYLYDRDIEVYKVLEEVGDDELKITELLDYALSNLNNLINDEEFDAYKLFPDINTETIRDFLIKMIKFFTSYDIEFKGLYNIYSLGDRYDNTIRILDSMHLRYRFTDDAAFILVFNRIADKLEFLFKTLLIDTIRLNEVLTHSGQVSMSDRLGVRDVLTEL